MKEEMDSPFKVLDASKNRLDVQAFEGKFFFEVDLKEFTLRFNDKRYGAFLSYDHRNECVSEFIFPEVGRDIKIQASQARGVIIFIPIDGIDIVF